MRMGWPELLMSRSFCTSEPPAPISMPAKCNAAGSARTAPAPPILAYSFCSMGFGGGRRSAEMSAVGNETAVASALDGYNARIDEASADAVGPDGVPATMRPAAKAPQQPRRNRAGEAVNVILNFSCGNV